MASTETTKVPGSDWLGLPGSINAVDVAVGPDGTNYYGNETAVWKWDGSSWVVAFPGGVRALSIGPGGVPWAVGLNDNTYRWLDGRWQGVSHEAPHVSIAKDVTINYQGMAWRTYDGFLNKYRHNWLWDETKGWLDMGGYGSKISAGGNGNAWHIGDDNKLWAWLDGWTPVDGEAYDIAVGPDNDAWHVGRDDTLYYRVGGIHGYWQPVAGDAVRIAPGPGGLPIILNRQGWIFRRV